MTTEKCKYSVAKEKTHGKIIVIGKGKVIPLQALSGLEGG
jgi:hypothetical protein